MAVSRRPRMWLFFFFLPLSSLLRDFAPKTDELCLCHVAPAKARPEVGGVQDINASGNKSELASMQDKCRKFKRLFRSLGKLGWKDVARILELFSLGYLIDHKS
ncbi:hypothetical protein CLAIMM_14768 [Cladophialophora immunda]|nr:hypothetical protein CLAIMM_14768 [Cladophialophora immunda]